MNPTQFMKHKRLPSWSRHRRGYLLVATLFVIALVSIMTVGFARLSMNHAISTIDAERNLQSKWGAASCERFAFANQALLLSEPVWNEQENRIGRQPIARSYCNVSLGDQSFLIRLDDESAKLNVNLIVRETNSVGVKTAIRKVATINRLQLNPRPTPEQFLSASGHPFDSLGQVYSFTENQLFDAPESLFQASESVTCWGANVNYLSASDDVIYETAKALVGATNASKLQRARRRSQIPQIIDSLAVDATRLEKTRRAFRPQSSAQSIWIINKSPTFTRHTLSVREKRTRTIIRHRSFAW